MCVVFACSKCGLLWDEMYQRRSSFLDNSPINSNYVVCVRFLGVHCLVGGVVSSFGLTPTDIIATLRTLLATRDSKNALETALFLRWWFQLRGCGLEVMWPVGWRPSQVNATKASRLAAGAGCRPPEVVAGAWESLLAHSKRHRPSMYGKATYIRVINGVR